MWRHITDFHPDETTMQELLCYNHRTPEMQYFCRVPKVVLCDPRNHWPTRVRWDWTEDKTRELRDLCWCQSKCICDMRVLLNCLKCYQWVKVTTYRSRHQPIFLFSETKDKSRADRKNPQQQLHHQNLPQSRWGDKVVVLSSYLFWSCHKCRSMDRVLLYLSQRSSNEIRTKVAISKQIKRTNGTVGRCRDDTIRGRNVL